MIDTDRMTNGKEVANKLRSGKGGGIPWIVILDGEGEALINSDGPKGNVGCPAAPHEIAHFLAMIDKTRSHMSAIDRGILERELRIYGAGLMARRSKSPGFKPHSEAIKSVRVGRFDAALKSLQTAITEGYPVEKIVGDSRLRPLREDPDRRLRLFELIAKHTKGHQVRITDSLEPGRRIRLRGTVVDMATDKPLAGALIKFFQTDAGGEYRPGMVAGGGAGNPRLFGYLRTDAKGRFELDTIMPERYSNSSVPRHVHYHVWAKGYAKLNSECFFDEDPLLSAKTRKSAPSRNFPIVKLQRDKELRLVGELKVRVPGKAKLRRP